MNTPFLSSEDQALINDVLAHNRRALAKTITLIESTRDDHKMRAQAVLAALLPHSGKAIRIGISGVPGAGKSTFIEAFGNYLVEKGHKLAVLAVDPSSSLTGGSILGDKTRMESLCLQENAFIRPSPSSGSLGGVAAKSRESMLACEASGYDVIIIETVGVGQSETTVAGMVDIFILLQLPNAGDDLQAIKKGIVEIADLIAVNKIDTNPTAAKIAIAQWKQALGILRPAINGWKVPIVGVSALQKTGLEEFWAEISRYQNAMQENGAFAKKRQQQAKSWLWSQIEEGLHQLFRANSEVKTQLPDLLKKVEQGEISPNFAAQQLLAFLEK